MVRLREKVFRNSSGYKFNVSFVDWTSVFVKSVLEAKVTKSVLKTVLVSTFLAVLKSLYCAYFIACSSMVSSRA